MKETGRDIKGYNEHFKQVCSSIRRSGAVLYQLQFHPQHSTAATPPVHPFFLHEAAWLSRQ